MLGICQAVHINRPLHIIRKPCSQHHEKSSSEFNLPAFCMFGPSLAKRTKLTNKSRRERLLSVHFSLVYLRRQMGLSLDTMKKNSRLDSRGRGVGGNTEYPSPSWSCSLKPGLPFGYSVGQGKRREAGSTVDGETYAVPSVTSLLFTTSKLLYICTEYCRHRRCSGLQLRAGKRQLVIHAGDHSGNSGYSNSLERAIQALRKYTEYYAFYGYLS